MSLHVSPILRAGLLPSASTPAGITSRLLLTMGSLKEDIFYQKPIIIRGRYSTFLFFNCQVDSVNLPGQKGLLLSPTITL